MQVDADKMKNDGVWSEWVTSWTSHVELFAFLCKITPLCADPPLVIEQFPDGVDLQEKLKTATELCARFEFELVRLFFVSL